jgi:purine nucleoside phosphorylase
MSDSGQLAIIIGSGFESLAGDTVGRDIETRFGRPSAPVYETSVEGLPVLTLARHGDQHTIPPHAINYRANLVALQQAGARSLVALNTVGVISAIRAPGDIGIPQQLLDYTWGREHTIFDGADGTVDHVDLTQPFTQALRQELLNAARSAGIDCHDGGVYAATQGPRLETAAEVDRLERDGADYIGMTAMPEAALARELGLDYASIAMVVNRAAGRGDRPIHDDVEFNTLAARSATMSVLRQLCRNRTAEG